VGRATTIAAAERGISVRAAVRGTVRPGGMAEVVRAGDLRTGKDWERALAGVTTVIHLAARVHVMRDPATDPLEAFRAINVEGTARLARTAVACGVRRFIFVSSVKVHGETTSHEPLNSSSPLAPADPYGRSKAEAEKVLTKIAAGTGIEVLVVRPPLVYGPGVGANFLSLVRLIDWGVPLPLGGVRNRRSFLYVGNLANLLLTAAMETRPVAGAVLVADGPPISSPDLVRRIARALGRRAWLFPVPPTLLRVTGAVTGRSAVVGRILDSLEVDVSGLTTTLGWTPPVDMDEGLRRTAEWYRSPECP
jgi:nucleoside-diphosphate-sugar epimerase